MTSPVGYAEVTVSDINTDMLRVGEERAKGWRFPSQVKFVEANAAGAEQLKTFINTGLGETWKDRGEAPDWERLYDKTKVEVL